MYSGPCAHCGKQVLPNQGWLAKNQNLAWRTLHDECKELVVVKGPVPVDSVAHAALAGITSSEPSRPFYTEENTGMF